MRPIHRLAPSSILAIATLVVFVASSPPARAGTVQRSYAAGKYALELGKEASYVKSIEGGNMRGEVVTDPSGDKHIGRVAVEPIRAQIDNDDFTQFIQQALADPGKSQAVDGAIVALDYDGKFISRRDFSHAMLTEVSFPEFNAASKDVAAMTIALVPESASDFKGGGVPTGIKDSAKTQQKKWMPANFRMKLGQMPTDRVTRIEAIKLTRPSGTNEDALGEKRDYQKAPAGTGNWQVPNIVFYVNAVDALPYWKWAEDSLNKGNGGNEQTLTIDALDQARKEVLLTLTCSGVGLVSARMEPVAANADALAHVRVEVYAEKIALTPGGGAAAAAAAPPDQSPAPAPTPAAGASTGTPAPAPAGSGAPAAAATGDATAAPGAGTPAPAPAPAPARKKRPAPALTPVPGGTPLEPVQKPTRTPPG